VRHVAVIDPGTRVPELDCFNRMSLAASVPLTIHLPALFGVESLHRMSAGVVGIVVLGSGASPLDGTPWQAALDEWLLPRLADDVPTLGLCYGHQHLAHRLGGALGFLSEDRHKRKGTRRVSLDADPLWGEACEGPMVVSHREVVTRVPPGFRVVGHSPEVPIEAFSHPDRPIWGLQPHPEATTAFTDNNAVPFDADPEILAFGHQVVDAFLALASARKE